MRIRIYKPCDVDGFTAVPLEVVDAVGSSRAVAIFPGKINIVSEKKEELDTDLRTYTYEELAETVAKLRFFVKEVLELKLRELGSTFPNDKGIDLVVYEPRGVHPFYAYGEDMFGHPFAAFTEDIIVYVDKEGGLGLTSFATPNIKQLFENLVSKAKKVFREIKDAWDNPIAEYRAYKWSKIEVEYECEDGIEIREKAVGIRL